MVGQSQSKFYTTPGFQPIMRELGIDADAVFEHPLIKPWRTINDRENCTLDATLIDGRQVRWHVKRYAKVLARPTPAEREIAGHGLLVESNIPTYVVVGWGVLANRRSFVIAEDLAGYRASDKLLDERAVPFDRLLEPTADLTARFHDAGLHHRDLYLCHFLAKLEEDRVDLRLIDTARIRRIPRLFSQRWIVKDLAQFWYSTLKHPITDEQRIAWLRRYAAGRELHEADAFLPRIRRRIKWMARHDVSLNRKQPHRNISIPQTP
jgi:hypothetical protein